jgi:hypothetical protein
MKTEAEIALEITARVRAELPLLAGHLQEWLQAHQTTPRPITAWSDLEATHPVQVWLLTEHSGDRDANSRVVYDVEEKMFGLVMEVGEGVVWYMGAYGSLAETVQSI